MDKPLVSVVITTYNRSELVETAIKSILNQNYKNVEIVVVNDCSKDGTDKVLEKLKKQGVKLIILSNDKKLGVSVSSNKGLTAARGKYVARLDDDDAWADERKLEKQVDFMEKNPDYVLVGGGIIKVNSNGQEISRYIFSEEDQDIRKIILIHNTFAHSTVLYRKEFALKVGGYNDRFGFFSDKELWLKLGTVGKFYNFQEYFAYYRETDNSGRRSDQLIRRRLLINLKLRTKYKEFYPGFAKSCLVCLANYFYSFIPFKKKLQPLLFKLRIFLLGAPYKYSKSKDDKI